MSLRQRLLLVIVVLNLAVVGVVQLAAAWVDRQRTEEQRDVYVRLLQTLVADAYAPDRPYQIDARWVRKLLVLERFRGVLRDIVVTSGGPGGTVDVNPIGAIHRQREGFPLADIRAGIRRAMREQRSVVVGDGLCMPIHVSDEVVGGAWYVPVDLPTSLPFAYFAIPVLVAGAITALLATYTLGRAFAEPLRRLGNAAVQVGAGDTAVRVERILGAPELNALVDAFNAMASRVAGHTDELRQAVQRATAETERRERALIVSSRLAAMGTLAAGIAHEINNPIGGMLNAVHRLLQRGDLDDRGRRYLELVRDGLERVSGIARKVLDFSPRRIDPAPFALAAAVDATLPLVEHRCTRAGVVVAVEMPLGLPDVVGDRHEIQQVVLNCLINALDALEEWPAPRVIRVTADDQGPWVRLCIEDNGPGTDAATLARAFDPFFSDKNRPDASGLGLFISHSIVMNHGGEMELHSRPGEGFRVEIRLPRHGKAR